MFTLMFGFCILAAILFAPILSERIKEKKTKKLLFVLGMCSLAAAVIFSVASWNYSDAERLPDGYEPVRCFTLDGIDRSLKEVQLIGRNNNGYIMISGDSPEVLWTPFGKFNYVPYDESGSYCPDCDVICTLPNCVLCGKTLSNCTHNVYRHSASVPYCGICGERRAGDITNDENICRKCGLVCQTPYCGECGAKQASSSAVWCPTCGAICTAAFCWECGTWVRGSESGSLHS